MSLYKQFATNSEKEMEGVEVQMTEAENEDGSIPTFVVSRMASRTSVILRRLKPRPALIVVKSNLAR